MSSEEVRSRKRPPRVREARMKTPRSRLIRSSVFWPVTPDQLLYFQHRLEPRRCCPTARVACAPPQSQIVQSGLPRWQSWPVTPGHVPYLQHRLEPRKCLPNGQGCVGPSGVTDCIIRAPRWQSWPVTSLCPPLALSRAVLPLCKTCFSLSRRAQLARGVRQVRGTAGHSRRTS
jgi:hypothetical protein